jgi:hypothetical protein
MLGSGTLALAGAILTPFSIAIMVGTGSLHLKRQQIHHQTETILQFHQLNFKILPLLKAKENLFRMVLDR